jgi:hypothetical protein
VARVTVYFEDYDEAETTRAKTVTELESIKIKWGGKFDVASSQEEGHFEA